MAFDFVVLGATGMQGKIVSRDLLENGYSVLLCGRDKARVLHILKRYKKTGFEFFEAKDITQMADIIKRSGADIVVNCVEGDWNLNIMKAAIRANTSILDLGSEIAMTKEQIAMSHILKKKNITSITGCGSVPGVGNVMLNYASRKFDSIDTIEVGFAWDSNIKKFVVPFSIQSIMEEFTDPAPIIKNRRWIKTTPLRTIIIDHHKTIEDEPCFFVRHPETYTFYKYFRDMGVKNIRFYAGFPKHSFDVINALIDVGFANWDDMNFKGVKTYPGEFLAELVKKIKMPEGYTEKENLWIKVYGRKKNKKKVITMECLVPTLKGWEDAGCNIDTGMPASIMAQMLKTGLIKERGSFAPEAIVPPEPFFKELKKRRMKVLENGKLIN